MKRSHRISTAYRNVILLSECLKPFTTPGRKRHVQTTKGNLNLETIHAKIDNEHNNSFMGKTVNLKYESLQRIFKTPKAEKKKYLSVRKWKDRFYNWRKVVESSRVNAFINIKEIKEVKVDSKKMIQEMHKMKKEINDIKVARNAGNNIQSRRLNNDKDVPLSKLLRRLNKSFYYKRRIYDQDLISY